MIPAYHDHEAVAQYHETQQIIAVKKSPQINTYYNPQHEEISLEQFTEMTTKDTVPIDLYIDEDGTPQKVVDNG